MPVLPSVFRHMAQPSVAFLIALSLLWPGNAPAWAARVPVSHPHPSGHAQLQTSEKNVSVKHGKTASLLPTPESTEFLCGKISRLSQSPVVLADARMLGLV